VAERVRVAHVITRLILGGAQENTLLTAIGQHQDRRYDVTLVVGADDEVEGSLHAQARAAGLRMVVIPSLVRPIRPASDLRALAALRALFRRERYHIVHTHSSKAGILGRVAAKLAGVPIVVHTLHSLVFHEYQAAWQNRIYILLKRACAPLTDVLISVNDQTARGALAAGIGGADKHLTIHSGIPLDPFLGISDRLPVAEAKRQLGIPAEAPTVGKIARLFPLKGHDQFFDAAARIAAQEPRAWFILVGDGPLRESLEARAAALGIRERTVFTGRVDPADIPACIQAMDVVVHTSLREGIARVLPQAGAVGKPVVTFALDGAPEVIVSGESGILVPPLDTVLLADHVVELMRAPGRREAFGRRARAIAEQHFRVEHMVERIDRVYQDLLARKLPGLLNR
jgi:glycosyltransferase involved in cell wall biosynthesis